MLLLCISLFSLYVSIISHVGDAITHLNCANCTNKRLHINTFWLLDGVCQVSNQKRLCLFSNWLNNLRLYVVRLAKRLWDPGSKRIIRALRCPWHRGTVSCSSMSDLASASRLSRYRASLGHTGGKRTPVWEEHRATCASQETQRQRSHH